MTALTQKQNIESLVDNIFQTHAVLQQNAVRAVNRNLTLRNWLIGYYIVEYEQKGEDRAAYGTRLLEEMAEKLKARGLKGLTDRILRSCRTFCILYPQIRLTVSAELQQAEIDDIKLNQKDDSTIRGTVPPELRKNDTSIPLTLSAELQQSEIIEDTPISDNDLPICRTLSGELINDDRLPAEMLLSKLVFSHFIELIRIEDSLERLFYEVETIKNNWSVRKLRRAIDTSLYVRTGLSKNKEAVVAKIKNLKPANNAEIIRNPYFLEFLELEEKPEYSESDLEQSIINHLQKFLVELGTGFYFEARQKRITFSNKHYKIDLVLYHRILKCHVLIDLKIGTFDHADAGQMTLYLNYFKKNEMAEDDNLPIGIILCADKDDALVEYTTTGIDNQLFVSKYLIKLPNKKTLEDFIRKELNN